MFGTKSQSGALTEFAPGLANLLNYERSNLSHDLVAGLSVAAVALPVGVAYAQLAGFNPAVELYSSILPLVAYTIFGTSRQLIMWVRYLGDFHPCGFRTFLSVCFQTYSRMPPDWRWSPFQEWHRVRCWRRQL